MKLDRHPTRFMSQHDQQGTPASPCPPGPTRVRLGVSTCLLGEPVRWNGGHSRSRILTETLAQHMEFVSVCPEIELGLGAPRETLRLVGEVAEKARLVFGRSGEDITERMAEWSRRRADELAGLDLDGYVLKKDSPTCGMERVKLYDGNDLVRNLGIGIYARALMARMPDLPIEEDGRLTNAGLRESFLERVYARRRWKDLLASRPRPRDLVAFHQREKMGLLAHGRSGYAALGRLVAGAGARPFEDVLASYGREFMTALSQPATREGHADALSHLAGHLRGTVPADDRQELAAHIRQYREGLVPLVVPITLLAHHLRHVEDDWASGQTYLRPYPDELMLRNFV